MTPPRRSAPASAVLIAVGSELLTPHKVDTNSLYLTEQLDRMGVAVRRKLVTGDDAGEIGAAVRQALRPGELIILTGGLGPTDDDRTRETVAGLLGLPLAEDPAIVADIRARFAARGLEMPDLNRRQALVPAGADVLANRRGTAPGLWIDHEQAVVVLLPGPPRELRPMFEQHVAARLAGRAGVSGIHRRVLRIAGRAESAVEAVAYPVYCAWQTSEPAIETTVLSTLGQIELHLSTRASRSEEAERRLDTATAELAAVLGRDLFSSDGSSLEAVVGVLLRRHGLRVAVAESCTGGLVTSRLTDVPGSSAYVHAAWVAYSNHAKVAGLGVDADLLEANGAVSEAVADAMAQGARSRAGVDVGLGVTGVAGPGGGSADKPVGTVWVALAGPGSARRARRLQLPGERDRVKFQASQAALDMLRRALLRL